MKKSRKINAIGGAHVSDLSLMLIHQSPSHNNVRLRGNSITEIEQGLYNLTN